MRLLHLWLRLLFLFDQVREFLELCGSLITRIVQLRHIRRKPTVPEPHDALKQNLA
jgi:hypothetical protein